MFICLILCSKNYIFASEIDNKNTEANIINSDGLTYEFIFRPFYSQAGEKLYDNGEIKVTKSSTQEVVFLQETQQSPGCEGFPSISTLPTYPSKSKLDLVNTNNNIVVLCGSTGGPHQTLYIFSHSPLGLQVSALDFYTTKVNISFDEQLGAYLSLVARRSVKSDLYGIALYPILYKFQNDDSTAGFTPVSAVRLLNIIMVIITRICCT